ncbi:NETI motif-containing protein [Neobacillus notoginsengisoli]|uniref:NETI motif-containing protein n=1 Tax=Neobacillus notoginsengisoli TaxID=1578198 RepID=A0A417YHP0_9BACI|nr:NETI motif-containing protein [Neobacillus notoginsengisoli]RHW32481.1 NETI motif-containing protein [Neobacillus notoginsengisoli]
MEKKMRFEVMENETIDECLERMKKKGYTPIRRIEKPIFKEEGKEIVPAGRQIIFEAKATE